MATPPDTGNGPFGPISRRSAIGSMIGGAALFEALTAAGASAEAQAARQRYEMKKSINLWAFPYPQKMTLTQCLQLAKDAGFDGIELNYDLDSDLSPKSGTREFQEIRKTGRSDRHRHQRTLLVPVLALPADEQRRSEAHARSRAGRADGPGRPRPRHREPARGAGRGPHPVARRSRAGPERRLRPPGARGNRQPGVHRGKAEGLSEHREHLLQRLPDVADGDERVRGQLCQPARPRPFRHRATSCSSSIRNTGLPSSASESATRTSRNSPRRAPTTHWSRSGRCSTGRRTGRPSWTR